MVSKLKITEPNAPADVYVPVAGVPPGALALRTLSYKVSGAISAPFGQDTVPPSTKNRRK